jgi:hypothetical protein
LILNPENGLRSSSNAAVSLLFLFMSIASRKRCSYLPIKSFWPTKKY